MTACERLPIVEGTVGNALRVPIGITASGYPRLPKAKTVPPKAVIPMVP